jgi:hypothetical protein
VERRVRGTISQTFICRAVFSSHTWRLSFSALGKDLQCVCSVAGFWIRKEGLLGNPWNQCPYREAGFRKPEAFSADHKGGPFPARTSAEFLKPLWSLHTAKAP